MGSIISYNYRGFIVWYDMGEIGEKNYNIDVNVKSSSQKSNSTQTIASNLSHIEARQLINNLYGDNTSDLIFHGENDVILDSVESSSLDKIISWLKNLELSS